MVWRNWDTILQSFTSLLCLVRRSFHIVIGKVASEQRNLSQDLVFIAADAAKKLRGVFTLPKLPVFNETEKSE